MLAFVIFVTTALQVDLRSLRKFTAQRIRVTTIAFLAFYYIQQLVNRLERGVATERVGKQNGSKWEGRPYIARHHQMRARRSVSELRKCQYPGLINASTLNG